MPDQFRVLTNRFIVFTPSPDDIAEAFRRSKKLGIPPSSITRGAGRMTGFIGEIAFEKFVQDAKYVGDKSFTHDYLLGNKTVEVKSKKCGSPPRLEYNAFVNAKRDQPPTADLFFFTRVSECLSKVWLCGWTTNQRLVKPSNFVEKGHVDDGFTFRLSGYVMPIRKLQRPDSLERYRRYRMRAKG